MRVPSTIMNGIRVCNEEQRRLGEVRASRREETLSIRWFCYSFHLLVYGGGGGYKNAVCQPDCERVERQTHLSEELYTHKGTPGCRQVTRVADFDCEIDAC